MEGLDCGKGIVIQNREILDLFDQLSNILFVVLLRQISPCFGSRRIGRECRLDRRDRVPKEKRQSKGLLLREKQGIRIDHGVPDAVDLCVRLDLIDPNLVILSPLKLSKRWYHW